MELHEVVHARRHLASELEQVVSHAVVTPLLVKIGHHREVVDEVRWHPRLPKPFAPLNERRYIHEEKIRRRVQLQLNRGEARHELARWLFFANRGEFRTGDYEEIMNKASCLSLLSNAVLVWNTIKIGDIVGQLRAAGEQIDDADLSRVSPLAHRHVIPNGTYFHNQAVGDPKE
jgi:hypothetical protein